MECTKYGKQLLDQSPKTVDPLDQWLPRRWWPVLASSCFHFFLPSHYEARLFPEVDEILPLVESGYDDDTDVSSTSGYPRIICGQAFLNLLKKMRTILIQDAVFLRVDYPHNPILSNSLFQEPDFLQYESTLLEVCRTQ
jgi:hypothetical protein